MELSRVYVKNYLQPITGVPLLCEQFQLVVGFGA